MTAGGAVTDLMKTDHQIPELYAEGSHHLWQDFTAVHDQAAPLLMEGLLRFAKQLGIPAGDVDHYVVSIPTIQLYEKFSGLFSEKMNITLDQVKFRSAERRLLRRGNDAHPL